MGRQVKSFSLVELAIAQRVSKSAPVFSFVGPSRKGGRLPGVLNGDRGNW